MYRRRRHHRKRRGVKKKTEMALNDVSGCKSSLKAAAAAIDWRNLVAAKISKA
jgi:hypothetical protein